MKTNLNIVPKELSERLLKLGFDYEVDHVYLDDELIKRLDKYTNEYDGKIPAPYPEIVIQFFREVHSIDIFMARIGNVTMPNLGYSFICFIGDDETPKYMNAIFESYEDAQIEAIKNILDYLDGTNNFLDA